MFRKLAVVAMLGLLLVLVACNSDKSSKSAAVATDQKTVNTQQEIYSKGQPVPLFDYSQTRQSLIQIYMAKTRAVNTWSVFFAFDKPVFVCPSIGYPIPADTQLTNPAQVVRIKTRIRDGADNWDTGVVDQAEPDGTYTSQNTNGTYVLCVRPDGKVTAVYSEPTVLAYPFEVRLVNGNIVDAGGDPSYSIDVKR